MRRLAHDRRELERHDLQLLEGARCEERDRLVVVDVDDAVDVGAEAEDLAVELMADAGHLVSVEEGAPRDVGDHHVFEGYLFEGDLGGLRVDHAVGERRVRDADRNVAKCVVDVPARNHHARVLQQEIPDPLVEADL